MKKLLLTFMAVSTMFTACKQEQEDFFSESSAIRADKTISENIEILTSAPHGWALKYYPSKTQAFGGYNFAVAFTRDGKVTISGEADIAGSTDKKATSLYRVNQSAGITLSFDSYNDIFSQLADPGAPIAGDSGEGMGGDNEFSILSACADSVVLKGRTSGNRAVMYPLESDDWKGYLDELADVDRKMFATSYSMAIGTDTFEVVANKRGLNITYVDDGKYVTTSTSYIITKEGMELYKPFEFMGRKITGFAVNDDGNRKFLCKDDPGIELIVDPLNKQFVNGLWGTTINDMGSMGKNYWTNWRKSADALGEKILLAAFGYYNYQFGLVFGTGNDNDGYVLGQIYFTYELIGDDEVELFCKRDGDDYGAYYLLQGYHYGAGPFGYGRPFRFKVSTDNLKDHIDLKCLTIANNDIRLYTLLKSFPLDEDTENN